MKILHCSDLHLDAPTESRLPPEKAKERRNELLTAFSRMVDSASKEGARAIIIAGDLFDRSNATKRSKKFVTEAALAHPDIDFLILVGNHDVNAFTESDALPQNMFFLYSDAAPREYENVTVSAYSEDRVYDTDKINIAVLHGADGVDFELSRMSGKNIDYLALGHYHTYSETPIDKRGVACYSGCLEGRSFDECGEKGYVLLDIDTDKKALTHLFVPSSVRRVVEIPLDMTEGTVYTKQKELFDAALKDVSRRDIIRVSVIGTYEPGREKFYDHICSDYSDEFYYIEIRDRSLVRIDPADYVNDISLKGEFIRLVMSEVEDKEEQSRIISIGLKALMGNLD